jgi:hypothetical protein
VMAIVFKLIRPFEVLWSTGANGLVVMVWR